MSGGEPVALVLDGDGVDIEALWWSAGRGPAPAVLLTHPFGGDAHALAPMGIALRDGGYHTIAVSMRGFGRSGGCDDCGLRQPDDLIGVLRWMRDRREIDGERLGLYGRSQGGLVALLAAARTPVMLRAIAVWNPVTDIDHWRANTQYPQIPDYIDAVCGPDTRIRSPIDVAAAITAAVLLIHGAVDTRVPTAQSVMFAEALRGAGRHVELVLLEGSGHRFGPEGNAAALSRTLGFLGEHL